MHHEMLITEWQYNTYLSIKAQSSNTFQHNISKRNHM